MGRIMMTERKSSAHCAAVMEADSMDLAHSVPRHICRQRYEDGRGRTLFRHVAGLVRRRDRAVMRRLGVLKAKMYSPLAMGRPLAFAPTHKTSAGIRD